MPQKREKRGRKKQKKQKAETGVAGTNVPRMIDNIIPVQYNGWIKTVWRAFFAQNGSTSANVRIIATAIGAATDISLGGTTSSSINLALVKVMYDRYRVIEIMWEAEAENGDAVNYDAGIGLLNEQITRNNVNWTNFMLNPTIKRKLIPSGQIYPIVFPRERVNVSKFFGQKATLYDDSFVAATNGSSTAGVPANNMYLNWGQVNYSGVQTLGICWNVTLYQRVLFFERTAQFS
jgi:hypothetical protein